MRMRAVAISYAKSLVWIAMLIAAALEVVAIGAMLLDDVRHAAHGAHSDVLLMAIFVLIPWVIGTIGLLIMFAPGPGFSGPGHRHHATGIRRSGAFRGVVQPADHGRADLVLL